MIQARGRTIFGRCGQPGRPRKARPISAAHHPYDEQHHRGHLWVRLLAAWALLVLGLPGGAVAAGRDSGAANTAVDQLRAAGLPGAVLLTQPRDDDNAAGPAPAAPAVMRPAREGDLLPQGPTLRPQWFGPVGPGIRETQRIPTGPPA